VELGQLVLKRVLLLALLLDRAATQKTLPDGVPLLFRRGALIKSSTEVLAPSFNLKWSLGHENPFVYSDENASLPARREFTYECCPRKVQ
jgi:hypothetical protein